MTVLREILVRWTTINGGGKVSVLNFFADIDVAAQRAALGTFLDGICLSLDNSVSYVVDTAGREFEDTTGTLTGAWTESTAQTGTGGGTSEPTPDATMMLLRWYTPTIIAGRFLQGRTFIPGVARDNIIAGNLDPAVVTGVQTFQNSFIASAAGLVIWHRPSASSAGSSDTVTTAACWNELAVLRRRRG